MGKVEILTRRNIKYELIDSALEIENAALRIIAKLTGKGAAHFIHIGKTGGSALKFALRGNFLTDKYVIILHTHSTTLEDVPKGEKVFFSVRDPIKRFVSGFYSRFREGKPRYYYPHTPEEKRAFLLFKTPNDLAEALSSKNIKIKKAAIEAMRSIGHIRNSYWDWFKNETYFESRLDDILFVCRQEYLNEDFEKLKKILGLPESLTLPQDSKLAHKTPEIFPKELSEIAIENLKEWYKKDYEFLRLCEKYGLIPKGSYSY